MEPGELQTVPLLWSRPEDRWQRVSGEESGLIPSVLSTRRAADCGCRVGLFATCSELGLYLVSLSSRIIEEPIPDFRANGLLVAMILVLEIGNLENSVR